MQQRDLVIDIFHRTFQREPRTAGLAFHGAGLGLRGFHIRLRRINRGLGDVHLHLEGFFVELHEQIAFVDAVVVIDQHPRHLTGHARSDESHVAVHIRIIGGDGGERLDQPWDADDQQRRITLMPPRDKPNKRRW